MTSNFIKIFTYLTSGTDFNLRLQAADNTKRYRDFARNSPTAINWFPH